MGAATGQEVTLCFLSLTRWRLHFDDFQRTEVFRWRSGLREVSDKAGEHWFLLTQSYRKGFCCGCCLFVFDMRTQDPQGAETKTTSPLPLLASSSIFIQIEHTALGCPSFFLPFFWYKKLNVSPSWGRFWKRGNKIKELILRFRLGPSAKVPKWWEWPPGCSGPQRPGPWKPLEPPPLRNGFPPWSAGQLQALIPYPETLHLCQNERGHNLGSPAQGPEKPWSWY